MGTALCRLALLLLLGCDTDPGTTPDGWRHIPAPPGREMQCFAWQDEAPLCFEQGSVKPVTPPLTSPIRPLR